jgi:hypothetical protein
VVKSHTTTFFGETFPSLEAPANSQDFAVLRFAAEETNAKWRPGFYRVDSDLTALNDALRDLQR